jgi:hypothetical protein
MKIIISSNYRISKENTSYSDTKINTIGNILFGKHFLYNIV